MDQGPLVSEKIRAGRRFIREFQKYAPVRIAFWLKDDDGEWYLYIASDQITDENFDAAYGEVARLFQVMRDPDFDPFQVKLIGAKDRMAKAALEFKSRSKATGPTRLFDEYFGGVQIQEAYLYPIHSPEAA